MWGVVSVCGVVVCVEAGVEAVLAASGLAVAVVIGREAGPNKSS